MEGFFIYLLKSAGLMSIFYICYLLLLRNDTSFNLNRKYLLGGIIASAILPSLYFTKKVFVEIPEQTFYTHSQALPESISSSVSPTSNLWEVTGYLFLAVVAFLFLRFLLQLFIS
jgi:bla regulator protein blaR1